MFSFNVIFDNFKSTAAQATKWAGVVLYKLFVYFVSNAAHAPSGHYFGPKTTLTQGQQGTLKRFLSDGFPATVLISESFRNNHPIETGFHSEWLRYNPKGPRGSIPPKGAEGALRYPWAP